MNNFNKIFAEVKKHCQVDETILDDGIFQKIAAETNVTTERLHFYLECLRDIGLVRYSCNDKNRKVSLTEKGVKAEYVFPSLNVN